MTSFAEALNIRPGITAVIGSGGKTSLLYRLAEELRTHRVLLATSTHIRRPAHLPFLEEVRQVQPGQPVCVGSYGPEGKLTAPRQTFARLAALADYVLVEADGSKCLPLKAHAPYEPVIPQGSNQTIAVVGLTGLDRPIREAAHRPERYAALAEATPDDPATPERVARVLQREALHTRVLLNQADATDGRALAQLLSCPVVLGAVQKGEIQCLF